MADSGWIRQQRQLEVVQAAATHAISRLELEKVLGGFDYYIQTILPQNMDALVVKLVNHFAADNLQKLHFFYPLNWVEAVKERFAPRWFTKRWPVVYHHNFVDLKAIWAGYKPPTDRYGPYLPYVLQTNRTDGDDLL
jgi:hypothetical protein